MQVCVAVADSNKIGWVATTNTAYIETDNEVRCSKHNLIHKENEACSHAFQSVPNISPTPGQTHSSLCQHPHTCVSPCSPCEPWTDKQTQLFCPCTNAPTESSPGSMHALQRPRCTESWTGCNITAIATTAFLQLVKTDHVLMPRSRDHRKSMLLLPNCSRLLLWLETRYKRVAGEALRPLDRQPQCSGPHTL